ncbi:glycosyltransferase [Krasilnikovia sp. M28-CT-15]|uniref:glycosyltransferase n=1 Tax=Krasilnikovia sp. M28-CT-15 TaxID=3373540 RepID=UPI003876B8B9
MKRIFLLAMCRFPHGDAPANRVLALAKSLAAAGYAPFVIGNGVRVGLPEGDEVHGIPFSTIRRRKDSFLARLRNRIFPTLAFARQARRQGVADADCVYVTLGTLTLGLKVLCRFVWRKPLIVDCMEWFEASQFTLRRLSPTYLHFMFKFRVLCRTGHVVGISSLLCREFTRRGCSVLYLPPQVDLDQFPTDRAAPASGRIELFYGGTASRKDHIGTALEGLRALSADERRRVRLTLAGPSMAELASSVSGGARALDEMADSLRVVGRISRDEVLGHLSRSHFSILLRPPTRYAMAGFPSKIPESLAAGTPPILNLTSDLGSFLRDGDNCIVVEDCSPEAFARGLRRAIALSADDLVRLSRNARACAQSSFDYRADLPEIGAFIAKTIELANQGEGVLQR